MADFFGFNLPWFIFDLKAKQLITTRTIPEGVITDTKQIVLSEVDIPGLNFNPVQDGGRANRKVGFSIQLVNRRDPTGNILQLKQFENLRNQPKDLKTIFKSQSAQFAGASKVLYFWGTGSSIPLEYYVSKIEFAHDSAFVNRFGYPQKTTVSMELTLDEESLVYKMEEMFRRLASFGGDISGLASLGRGKGFNTFAPPRL